MPIAHPADTSISRGNRVFGVTLAPTAPPGRNTRLRHWPCLARTLSLGRMSEGGGKFVARQVEKGKALAIGEIVWRLDNDLNRRFSRIHLDGDFGIPEINLVAASISAPEDSMCHVCP